MPKFSKSDIKFCPQVYVCGVHCAAIAVPVTLMLCFYLVPGVRCLIARLKSR